MNQVVPPSTVSIYLRGQQPADVTPGDLVLVRHHGFFASAIRWSERLRRPRDVSRDQWRKFCRVNHAAIALGSGPGAPVAQATAKGIVATPIGLMGAYAMAVVHMEMAPAQRSAVVAFAHDSLGTGYGFAQIPADLFNALSGLELSLGWGNRMVCSTAACRSIERSDFIPNRSPDCVTPAHLAWAFDAVVPAV